MEPVVRVEGLKKYFPVWTGLSALLSRERKYVRAVDGVSFAVNREEILGLAGESGCGKTTTGRLILRLVEPTAGHVYFDGVDVFSLGRRELKAFRRKAQMIFQDPYGSLNPRRTVAETIGQAIDIHKLAGSREERMELIYRALEEVELKPVEEFIGKFPHMLSGGQRQRLAIARALVLRPKFIVADEPVSMLDVSVRAGILRLLLKLREENHISFLYITHDLATARHICDRIAIMYLGKIMELTDTETLVKRPLHPYTMALLKAVPVPDPEKKVEDIPIRGEVPLSPIDLPPGCRFHPRCPYAEDICRKAEPEMVELERGHYVACHLAERFL